MLPDWHLFKPSIRAMAELERLGPAAQSLGTSAPVNATCDVLVPGAGPAGLAASLTEAKAGRKVILFGDGECAGGSLLFFPAPGRYLFGSGIWSIGSSRA